MQILVALQTTVNQLSMEGLDVQQALLSAFDTLLSSQLTESAGTLLCRSGQYILNQSVTIPMRIPYHNHQQ